MQPDLPPSAVLPFAALAQGRRGSAVAAAFTTAASARPARPARADAVPYQRAAQPARGAEATRLPATQAGPGGRRRGRAAAQGRTRAAALNAVAVFILFSFGDRQLVLCVAMVVDAA